MLNIVLTKHAFNRYLQRVRLHNHNFEQFQEQLQEEVLSNLSIMKWNRQPAIFLNQAFWRYRYIPVRQEIILTTCLGISCSFQEGIGRLMAN